jgi:Rhamnan synthesis protein F
VEALYLLNDSLFGPTSEAQFKVLLHDIRRSNADLVGITDSYELGWHIQSYFLVLKKSILVSLAMQRFFANVISYSNKDDVIQEYEIKFSQAMRAAGMTCRVLFPSTEAVNATLFYWKDLIRKGFPFVKVMAIRDGYVGGDEQDWRQFLNSEGFDVSLVDRALLFAKISQMRLSIARSSIPTHSVSSVP